MKALLVLKSTGREVSVNFPARSAASNSSAPSTVCCTFSPRRACANFYFYPDLSAPVDVYADWVDACDTVAKEGGDHTGIGDFGPSRVSLPGSRNNAERARDEEDERDDDIIDDEDDDGADGYGGDGIVADDEY
jgi:transcription elongation factor Elf1